MFTTSFILLGWWDIVHIYLQTFTKMKPFAFSELQKKWICLVQLPRRTEIKPCFRIESTALWESSVSDLEILGHVFNVHTADCCSKSHFHKQKCDLMWDSVHINNTSKTIQWSLFTATSWLNQTSSIWLKWPFSGDYTTLQFASLSPQSVHQLWDVIAAGTNKTALEGSFVSLAEGLVD